MDDYAEKIYWSNETRCQIWKLSRGGQAKQEVSIPDNPWVMKKLSKLNFVVQFKTNIMKEMMYDDVLEMTAMMSSSIIENDPEEPQKLHKAIEKIQQTTKAEQRPHRENYELWKTSIWWKYAQ